MNIVAFYCSMMFHLHTSSDALCSGAVTLALCRVMSRTVENPSVCLELFTLPPESGFNPLCKN